MKFIIEGKEAVLPKDLSFEYICENRLFTKAEGYSLSISFPLRGCPENIEIFGNINRKDVTLKKAILNCDIHDKNIHLHGSLAILQVTDIEVKTQFLAGKSAENYDSTLEELYINELPLGAIDKNELETDMASCEYAWRSIDEEPTRGWVALPWVNNTSGNMQNRARWNNSPSAKYWYWDMPQRQSHFSFQLYLIFVTKKICDAMGFTYNFSEWDNSDYRYLLICNSVPSAWDDRRIATILPHWTVAEYFSQLEMIMDSQFDIDIEKKHITMTTNNEYINKREIIIIDNIIDAYSYEIKEQKSNSYIKQRNLRYAEGSANVQKYYSCQWLVDFYKDHEISYNTLQEAYNVAKATLYPFHGNKIDDAISNTIIYIRNLKKYFIIRVHHAAYDNRGNVTDLYTMPVLINEFGPVTYNEDAQYEEIKIIPAWLDFADNDKCIFLECGEYGEKDDPKEVNQTFIAELLNDGEKEDKEFFSNIFIGYWDGNVIDGKLPCPVISRIETAVNYDIFYNNAYSLDLKERVNSRDILVDQNTKYTFSFISKTIPDVEGIFVIKGKRYLCEKITATFTIDGMSQLLKGVFYRTQREPE